MSNKNLEKEFQNYCNMMFARNGNEYYNNKDKYKQLLNDFIISKKIELENNLKKFIEEKNKELPIRLVDLFKKYKSNKGIIKHKNRKSELDIFCELNEIKEKFTENQIKSFKNRQQKYNNKTNYDYFNSLYQKMIGELSINNKSINNISINKFTENYKDFKNNEEYKNRFKEYIKSQKKKNPEERYFVADNEQNIKKHTRLYWDKYFKFLNTSNEGYLRAIGNNGIKDQILIQNPEIDLGVKISLKEYKNQKMIGELSINNTSINKFTENYKDFKNNEEYIKSQKKNPEERYFVADNEQNIKKHTRLYWDKYFKFLNTSNEGYLRAIGNNGIKDQILIQNPEIDSGVKISLKEYHNQKK